MHVVLLDVEIVEITSKLPFDVVVSLLKTFYQYIGRVSSKYSDEKEFKKHMKDVRSWFQSRAILNI